MRTEDNRLDPDWYKRQAGVTNGQVAHAVHDDKGACCSGSGGPTSRDARMAALHQKYLIYVGRFERWDNRRGWVRFLSSQPLVALVSMAQRIPLPEKWRQQPLCETDFQIELFSDSARRMAPPD